MLSGVCRRRLSSYVTLHSGPVEFRPVRVRHRFKVTYEYKVFLFTLL